MPEYFEDILWDHTHALLLSSFHPQEDNQERWNYKFSSCYSDLGPSPLSADYLAYDASQARTYQPAEAHSIGQPPCNSENNDMSYLRFDATRDYDDSSYKRRRGNLPKHVTDRLKDWFQKHWTYPYPTEEEKQMLMAQTGLRMIQVGFHESILTLQEHDLNSYRSLIGLTTPDKDTSRMICLL